MRTEKTTTTAIETPIVTLRSAAAAAAAKGGAGLKTERILDVLDGQFAAIVV